MISLVSLLLSSDGIHIHMWLNKQDTVAVLKKDQLFLLKCLKTQCPPSSPCVSIDDRVSWAYQDRYAAPLSCTVSANTFSFPIFTWYYHIAFCYLSHGELKSWTLKIWRDFRPSFNVKQHIWWPTLYTIVWQLSFPSWVWQQRNNGRHVIALPNNPSHQIKKSLSFIIWLWLGRSRGNGVYLDCPSPTPCSSFNHLLHLKSVCYFYSGFLNVFKYS